MYSEQEKITDFYTEMLKNAEYARIEIEKVTETNVSEAYRRICNIRNSVFIRLIENGNKCTTNENGEIVYISVGDSRYAMTRELFDGYLGHDKAEAIISKSIDEKMTVKLNDENVDEIDFEAIDFEDDIDANTENNKEKDINPVIETDNGKEKSMSSAIKSDDKEVTLDDENNTDNVDFGFIEEDFDLKYAMDEDIINNAPIGYFKSIRQKELNIIQKKPHIQNTDTKMIDTSICIRIYPVTDAPDEKKFMAIVSGKNISEVYCSWQHDDNEYEITEDNTNFIVAKVSDYVILAARENNNAVFDISILIQSLSNKDYRIIGVDEKRRVPTNEKGHIEIECNDGITRVYPLEERKRL